MNSTLATLAVFLVAAMFLSQAQALTCCYDYVKRPLPQRILKSYEYAFGMCPIPAIILITKANRRICADPNAAWVQDRIRYLDNN